MAKIKKQTFTINVRELQLNRAGKAHKGMSEVSTGCGAHVPNKFKTKNQKAWKKEVREYV